MIREVLRPMGLLEFLTEKISPKFKQRYLFHHEKSHGVHIFHKIIEMIAVDMGCIGRFNLYEL